MPGAVLRDTTSTDSRLDLHALNTEMDFFLPRYRKDTKRAIWELGQVRVFDGGPDGDADTADNSLFAVQGVFVP